MGTQGEHTCEELQHGARHRVRAREVQLTYVLVLSTRSKRMRESKLEKVTFWKAFPVTG